MARLGFFCFFFYLLEGRVSGSAEVEESFCGGRELNIYPWTLDKRDISLRRRWEMKLRGHMIVLLRGDAQSVSSVNKVAPPPSTYRSAVALTA